MGNLNKIYLVAIFLIGAGVVSRANATACSSAVVELRAAELHRDIALEDLESAERTCRKPGCVAAAKAAYERAAARIPAAARAYRQACRGIPVDARD